MKGLLQQFLSEAGDLLEQVDTGLLELERDPHDRALLDVVFRAAHTLKGSSGLFDLPQLTRLTHAAEDLLDAIRADRLELTAEMADDLLAAFDLIRRWLEVVEETEALPPDATNDGAALSARLRAPLGGEPAAARVPLPRAGVEQTDGPEGAAPAPGWLLEAFGAGQIERTRGWLDRAVTRCRVLRFEPSEQCFFAGEDPLHLVAQIPAIEALAVAPRRPWPVLDEFDEYACRLVFTVVTRATVAEVEHLFRYVPDELTLAVVDAESLAALLKPAPISGATTAFANACQVIAAQVLALRTDMPIDQARSRISSAGAVASAAFAAIGSSAEMINGLSAALAQALEDGAAGALAALLEHELEVERGRSSLEQDRIGQPAVGAQDEVSTLVDGVAGQREPRGADARAAEAALGSSDRRTGAIDRRTGTSRVLKVDQASVDRLLDLVGELVVAKNGLPFLAVAAEGRWNARPLARQIKDQYGVVDRISEELQAAVMEVRMLPMAVVFARFPRMIRDLARSLGKQVVLEQEGQDTAADKDVIEMLGDPLVHLVRNSLDHGIERPADRVAAGKQPQATIRLRAVQEPDAIVIDIIDDGRGIDPETIKLKAYERGLITEEQLGTLNDQDAVNLVFLPGFSTADDITDVSGRGVGMDAVRASVQAIGGTVRVSSTPGQGSRVTLRVPLSMAVSRVMIVTVGGQRFGVPVDLVIETVRVARDRITRVEHQDVIVLRDTVVPLVELQQTLRMTTDRPNQELVSVLVIRPGGDDIGLVVDSFQEGAEVIVKPMQGVLAGSRHFCGTALMGDGSVLLVLDAKEVLAGAGDPV